MWQHSARQCGVCSSALYGRRLRKHKASKQLGKELATGRRSTALLGVHLKWHPASVALIRRLQAGRALTLCTGDLHEQQAQRQGERRGAHGVRHLQCGVLVSTECCARVIAARRGTHLLTSRSGSFSCKCTYGVRWKKYFVLQKMTPQEHSIPSLLQVASAVHRVLPVGAFKLCLHQAADVQASLITFFSQRTGQLHAHMRTGFHSLQHLCTACPQSCIACSRAAHPSPTDAGSHLTASSTARV